MSTKESRREGDAKNNGESNDSAASENQGSGKVAEAHNSTGDQPATAINQGRRTPESRGDRDTHVGSGNQTQSRRGGGTGGGRGAG